MTDGSPASLEEAISEAAARLAGPVHDRFQAGLPAGDSLYVKVPFKTDSGAIEYLWVAVTSWQGQVLKGVVRSRPTWVTQVKAGDPVDVQLASVYDYLLRHADGTSEGNGTERFLGQAPSR